MSDLFVYGTLRFPEILAALLGRVPALVPARAEGWRVAALDGVLYPGMVAAPGGVADGLLIEGLTDAELAVLHEYEDVDYDARVIVLADGREALAYIWKRETLPADWDPAAFEAEHLAAYTLGLDGWRTPQ